LSIFIANLPPCLIGLEACGGSHYWVRLFSQWGHCSGQVILATVLYSAQ
jgi:transposase